MRVQPTSRAAALVALGALVSLVVPLVGAVMMVAVVLLCVIDAALARRRAPRIRRTLPPFLVRGLPAVLQLSGEVAAGCEVSQPGSDVFTIVGTAPGQLTIVASHRGRHRLPAASSRTVGPLGLAASQQSVTDEAELVVHPDITAARRLARSARSTSFDDEGGRIRGPLGLGTTFESLREYRPDDDVRLVNWKASARLGEPIVNQFRVEQCRDVMLLVDAGRLMVDSTFDTALEAVAAVALTADAVGDRCGLVAFAAAPIVTLAPRSGGGRHAVAALGPLEAMPVDSDFDVAFRSLPTKRAVVVVFTDLLDDLASAALVDAVPVLGRRHQVIVVTAEDQSTVEMVRVAATPGAPLAGAYRAAAAAIAIEDRDRAVARLRRVGARVVVARPEHLVAAACQAYLEVKLRGRA